MTKRWKRMMNPDYIGAYALDEGQELTLTIDHVVAEEVKGENGKSNIRPVAYFKEKYKPMVLNNTNCMSIEAITGSDLPDDWAGHQITIFATPVKLGKGMVEALRIRPKYHAQKASTEDERIIAKLKTRLDSDRELWIGLLIDEGVIVSKDELGTAEKRKEVYDRLKEFDSKIAAKKMGLPTSQEDIENA